MLFNLFLLIRRCPVSTSTAGEQPKAPQSWPLIVEWFELQRLLRGDASAGLLQ